MQADKRIYQVGGAVHVRFVRHDITNTLVFTKMTLHRVIVEVRNSRGEDWDLAERDNDISGKDSKRQQ
jgi:hypothetical protein